jgi:hypothetical protein
MTLRRQFSVPTITLSLLILLPSIAATPSAAQAPAETAPADRVEWELKVQRLLQQLNDPERSQRDAAEQQLIELGDSVLPLLPAVDASTAAETRERLIRIRTSLEQASADTVTKASRVTLEGTMPLSDILKAFEKQTGNRVIDFRERFGQQPSDQPLSIEFQGMEFWQALDQVLDQAAMTTYDYTGETRTLGIVARNPNDLPRYQGAAYSGIFSLAAVEIQTQRNLRSSTDAALRIRLDVQWEPRVVPVVIRQAYRDLQVKADDGSDIGVAMGDGAAEAPVQSTVAGIDLVLPLQLPPRSVKQIASIKGRLYAILPGREETFEFNDLAQARNVSLQKGGLEVTLDRVRKNGAVYELRVRLRLLNADESFESHLDWTSNNVVYLVDGQGNRIDNPNFERYLEGTREIGYAYLFPVEGDIKDYRLVYRSPAAILTVPIDYELKGIDLP